MYKSSKLSAIPYPPFAASGEIACKDEDPDLFFPITYRDSSVDKARIVCYSCKLVKACGNWAIENGEPDGVWGATTPEERRRYRTQRGLI